MCVGDQAADGLKYNIGEYLFRPVERAEASWPEGDGEYMYCRAEYDRRVCECPLLADSNRRWPSNRTKRSKALKSSLLWLSRPRTACPDAAMAVRAPPRVPKVHEGRRFALPGA